MQRGETRVVGEIDLRAGGNQSTDGVRMIACGGNLRLYEVG